MSPVSSGSVDTATKAEAEFKRLAAEWKQATAHFSSPAMIAEHRAYQKIMRMGSDVVPFILCDLQESQAQWFLALRSITGKSPVSPEDRGDVEAMTAAWLDWGKRNRYI